LDRALILYLPTIPKHKRQDEETFWSTFEQTSPQIPARWTQFSFYRLLGYAGALNLPRSPKSHPLPEGVWYEEPGRGHHLGGERMCRCRAG
jgi:hypothetical protein